MYHRFFFCTLLLGLSLPVCGQSIRDAVATGQELRIEWVWQMSDQFQTASPPGYPLYPDQLRSGDQEIRVQLRLYAGDTGRPEAVIDHISFLSIPARDPEMGQAADTLPAWQIQPLMVDTRFRNDYPHPRWLQFDQLLDLPFAADCNGKLGRELLNGYWARLDALLESPQKGWPERESLAEMSLPAAFTNDHLDQFFCFLQEATLPSGEHFVPLLTGREDGKRTTDYIRIDHPPRTTVLRGQIKDQVSSEVQIKFFKQGDWLSYWSDTLLLLDANGNFQLSFPLDQPQLLSLTHGYQRMPFYLEPGDTIACTINAHAFYRDMEFDGTSVNNQQFLLDYYHQLRGDSVLKSFDHGLLSRPQGAFLQEQLRKERRELEFLKDRQEVLSPDFAAYMERSIHLDYSEIIWEAAYRFYISGLELDSGLAAEAEVRRPYLYRLPPQKNFDFSAEQYLKFQFQRLPERGLGVNSSFANNWDFYRLVLSEETFWRYAAMWFFRTYVNYGQLLNTQQKLLNELLISCRDSILTDELRVFLLPRDSGILEPDVFHIIPTGRLAPDWQFEDREGIAVRLRDLVGRKVLLHLGWVNHLESALQDIRFFKAQQPSVPDVVHLLFADNRSEFNEAVRDQDGLFVYVPPDQAQVVRDSYRLENLANHYYLLDEKGYVLANNYDLGTPSKMRGAWSRIVRRGTGEKQTIFAEVSFWRNVGIAAFVLLGISLLYLWRKRINERQEFRKRQLLELELKGLRSQMNPHFLFNAMGTIQNLIRKNDRKKADLYLGQFAGLMRRILQNSTEEFIPLSEEIATLEQYCGLEALRSPFNFTFSVDPEIDQQNTYIPGMILQPIVENAIIHGLLPKKGERRLWVDIEVHPLGLKCIINDDGIGINKALIQRGVPQDTRKSYGMKLVDQRLALLTKNITNSLTTVDRSDLSADWQGTQVTLIIPVES